MTFAMTGNRLEALSDGVIAIIITIMVLELKVPHQAEVSALKPLFPVLSSYALSFLGLAIYWNNHHHLFKAVTHVDGSVLWANMHLLFWLSLFPFVTAWMGENNFAAVPVAGFGLVSLLSGISYYILVRALVRSHGLNSRFAQAVGKDYKGKLSVMLYGAAIPLALAWPMLAVAIYVLVAAMWFIPDRRMAEVATSHSRDPMDFL